MNDLDMLAEFGAALDEEPPPTLARQRNRLTATTRSRSHGLRWWPVAAGAVATGAAVAVFLATGTTPARAPAVTQPAPTLQLSAYELLNHAADVLETQPGVIPGPHQWIYEKLAGYGGGAPLQIREYWDRFDGLQEASVENGQVVIDVKHPPGGVDTGSPQANSQWLSSLPADPKAALAVLEAASTDIGSKTPPSQKELFSNVAINLWQSTVCVVPPRVLATLYRAIALFPGVRIEQITDGLGRHDLGVVYGAERVLIDPVDYAVLGTEQMGVWHKDPKTHDMVETMPNEVGYAMVQESVTVVNNAGDR